MTKKLEKLALEMACLNFGELTRKEIEVRMQAITAGLNRFDAEMVRQCAAGIARERAAAMTKEAAALDAFGRAVPEASRPPQPQPEAMPAPPP